MLNKEFCNILEYRISSELGKSPDIEIRRLWCDGVLMPELEKSYSYEVVKTEKRILTQAWIDEGRIKGKQLGQCLYDLTIYFGKHAIEYYAKGYNLVECIPDESNNWVFIDQEKRILEIRLL